MERREGRGPRHGVAAGVSALLASLFGAATLATPAARGPERVVEVLREVERTVKVTRYQHTPRVRPRSGEYLFDCSGMAEWVLRKAAPGALRAVGRPEGRRPLAVHFFKRIARTPPGEARGAWYRVPGVSATRPGDVVAWRRPPWFASKATGHVAFVVGDPVANPGPVRGYLVRVADASRFQHEDDSRRDGESGFGTGVLLLATDAMDRPRGYGWFGSASRHDWIVPCEIAIGRPLR